MLDDQKKNHRVVFFVNMAEYLKFKSALTLKGITVSEFLRDKIQAFLGKEPDELSG